jgi:hypothetical protein
MLICREPILNGLNQRVLTGGVANRTLSGTGLVDRGVQEPLGAGRVAERLDRVRAYAAGFDEGVAPRAPCLAKSGSGESATCMPVPTSRTRTPVPPSPALTAAGRPPGVQRPDQRGGQVGHSGAVQAAGARRAQLDRPAVGRSDDDPHAAGAGADRGDQGGRRRGRGRAGDDLQRVCGRA